MKINIGSPNLTILKDQFKKDLSTITHYENQPAHKLGFAVGRVALEVICAISGGIAIATWSLQGLAGVAVWLLAHDLAHILINAQRDDRSPVRSTASKVADMASSAAADITGKAALETNLYGRMMAKNTILLFIWEPAFRKAGQEDLSNSLKKPLT